MTGSEVNVDSKGFILVVDDVVQNIQVLCNILAKEKYRLAVARNGRQALETAEKVTPELILLDVMMPELDGFEVCKRLHDSPGTRDIPVIFLTAKTELESVVKGFEIGAVDYVTKPFNEAELLARVSTHLELKRAREELVKRNKELTEAQQKLELAVRTDPLTNISNRREILEKIEYEKIRFERNKKPFSLILADVDDFKIFNDKYGHECGDFVLVSLAQLMTSMVRKQDCVSRWGGEEFLLLLPETDGEGGRTIAEKIRQTIAGQTFKYDGIPLSITITVGISTFGYNCYRDIDDCIRMVDSAMYKGKQKGKNCVVAAQGKETG